MYPIESEVPLISRRKFLQSAAFCLVSPLLPIPEPAFPPDANYLKKSIEQEFGLELYTMHDFSEQERARYLISIYDLPSVPHFWEIDRLKMLNFFFKEIIPPHLYQPDQLARRVKLILSIRSRSDIFEDQPNRRIQLNYRHFHPAYPAEALEELVHELAHDKTPIKPTSDSRKFESPWFDRIDAIFETPYQEIQPESYYKILQVTNRIPPDQRETIKFYNELLYAFQVRENPAEVIGYGAQHFLYGRIEFLQRYGEIFPQHVTTNLYEFLRDEVFRGREYREFPI